MSDCVVVWWEGRGTQEVVQRLADVIATHLDDIESTTKGPVRSKSTGSLGNVLVEEEQKVHYHIAGVFRGTNIRGSAILKY